MNDIAVLVARGARLVAAGAFLLALIVALTHWAVRRGTLQAFGWWARFTRRWSDPIVVPLERRLIRAGANPQDAPAWLLAVTVVAALILVALVDWLIGFVASFFVGMQSGLIVPLVIHWIFQLLMLAIMIRVIASWLSLSPYNRFMRIVYALTDWLVDPIRRVVPTIGIFDISPLVAYFVLYIAEQLVMRAFF